MEGGGSSFETAPVQGKRRYKARARKSTTDSLKRTRRNWTDHEESLLLDKLKELVLEGWKSENGFRPGYQTKLEEMLMEALPGTDIRANPHINSKIVMWKRYYGSIKTMLTDNSGIGFNTTTHLIDCNNDMWEKIVKKDPSAATMRFKPWPMYDDWIEVFGNDRATGEGAEDVYEAFTSLVDDIPEHNDDVHFESQPAQGGNSNFEANGNPDQMHCSMDKDSETQVPTPTNGRRPTNSRKRSSSVVNSEDPLMDVLGQMATSSDKRLDVICDVFKYESSLGAQRCHIYNMLGEIPALTIDERIDTARLLVQNSGLLEMFMGFPDEARARFVHRLLSGDFRM